MIFAAVGTQAPFDRLVRVVDQWAEAHPDVEVRVQSLGGTYCPTHCIVHDSLPPDEFHAAIESAELVIGHAGIGLILAALTAQKHLVILPRRAAHGEHRNDHQLDTVKHLPPRESVHVVMDEMDLPTRIDSVRQQCCDAYPLTTVSPTLIHTVQQFILGAPDSS